MMYGCYECTKTSVSSISWYVWFKFLTMSKKKRLEGCC